MQMRLVNAKLGIKLTLTLAACPLTYHLLGFMTILRLECFLILQSRTETLQYVLTIGL